MDFRILGPFEVLEDGQPIDVGGAKQRALLCMLLLEANRVVSSDRLIDGLWEDEPPDTGKKALQVYVSQLRKTLGKERVKTRAPGYLLRLENGELDLERFGSLQEQGKLREALALWRGPPLADFAYSRFAQAEIARLEELRLACLEDRIEADLAAGRHAALVGELEALVQEHPRWERPRGQLMLALYRSGRQAEALDAYQDARSTLLEELGIEPGRELRELQQAILNQDPALDPIEAELLSDALRGVFVGRKAELAELLNALEDTIAGRGRLVLLQGEPGIGKSRLADELTARARGRGVRVLAGRCWEAGGAPAYWPWLQALRTYVRETEPEVLRAQLGAGAAELAQLLPELRELFPDLPEPLLAESESARFRLFEAASSFLRSASRARPIVVILDDLHAADGPSLLLLQFVGRELGESRVFIVGAFRDVDPTLRDPLVATLVELAREPVTQKLELGGLARDDVAEFISSTAGVEPSEATVVAIHEETEGNPLFVGEVTRLLLAEGALLTGEHVGAIGIPQGIRDVIGRRLRRLSEECRRTLALASVLGREFALDALVHLVGYDSSEILELLEEAMEARVVGEVAPGRLRFGHALIRDTIYDELTPARRLRLHAQAGEALEKLYAESIEPHLAELAYHFAAAAPTGDAYKAVEYARRAAERAASLLAFEEAARLYRLALGLLDADEPGERERRCDLLVALGDVLARSGDMPAAKETFLHAAELAQDVRSADRLACAALGYGGRLIHSRGAADQHVVPLLENAAAALPPEDSALRARVLARLASALRDQPTREPRDSLSANALEMARRLSDPPTLAYAIAGRLAATLWPENLEQRLALGAELLQATDKERVVEGFVHRSVALLALGNMPAFREELEAQARLVRELRQPAQQWGVIARSATLALFEGRFADAETLIDEAHAIGERAQSYEALSYVRIQRFALLREQGRLAEVEADTEKAADAYGNRPLYRCALAVTCDELGRREDAKRIFGQLTANEFAAIPFNNDWLLSAALLAELTACFQEAQTALSLLRALSPFGDLNVDTFEVSVGAVARYLGLAAGTAARWTQAEQHFEHALAMNERMGARPWLAHTQEDYARMLFARAGPGDAERAAELLHQALSTYRELGMEGPLAKARALATT